MACGWNVRTAMKMKMNSLKTDIGIAIGEYPRPEHIRRRSVERVKEWMIEHEPWALPYLWKSQDETWRFDGSEFDY